MTNYKEQIEQLLQKEDDCQKIFFYFDPENTEELQEVFNEIKNENKNNPNNNFCAI